MNKIIRLLMIVIISVSFNSCSQKENKEEPIKWEYKTLNCKGKALSDFYEKVFATHTEKMSKKLNQLGKEGWELVDVYTQIETVHPNFGNEKYVTGLQPNTRTSDIVYVFKRKWEEGRNNEKPYEEIGFFQEVEEAVDAPAESPAVTE